MAEKFPYTILARSVIMFETLMKSRRAAGAGREGLRGHTGQRVL